MSDERRFRPTAGGDGYSRLRKLALRTDPGGATGTEEELRHTDQNAADACDFCSEPLSPEHRHVAELEEQTLHCVCRACGLLFDRREAGGGRYRLVPDRVRSLEEFRLKEEDWSALGIPVDLAFFFRSSPLERVVSFYPGPMGATESLLGLERWGRLQATNPVLRTMEDDVEALLVDRRDPQSPQGWVVPIDACYRLVGWIRESWQGLAGGTEVWEGIETFFDEMQRRADQAVGRLGFRGPA